MVIGDDDGSYERMRCAFTDRVRGGYCRAIIVNPLHPDLPKLVVVVQVTCNRFTAAHVRDQWDRLRALWYRGDAGERGNLGKILGPLIGHASDGDARRFKLQIEDMRSTAGLRFRIGWPGFTLSGRVDENGHASCIHSQDTIHNAKKMLNPMDVASRVLQLGASSAVWEHVQLAFDTFRPDEHGLRASDRKRPDRQDFSCVQRAARSKLRSCLAHLRPRHKTEGSEAWLEIIHLFLIAHFGKKITVIDRVHNL